MDKSKVMLIQKQNSHAEATKNNPWTVKDKEVKVCASYKYLGVTIKSNGSFSMHIDTKREKAHKSYFPLFLKAKSGVVSSHVFFFIYFTIVLLLF